MKKLLMLLILVILSTSAIAQDKLYLIFEFMEVDNEQEAAYMETEEFWQKIHEQRVKNGDIIGWDLWQLKPGGENQHFQYMTVNLYSDPVKMFEGDGGFEEALKGAYPNMSEEERNKRYSSTTKSRDLAVRVYLEQIDKTDEEYDLPLGTVASINLMKVMPENFEKYEKMESEIFKPMHQKEVDNDIRESWGLLRIMSPAPYASDTYASHITVDMYKNFKQYFEPGEDTEFTNEQTKAINDGVATRDMKYVYLATLIKRAR